MGVGVIESDGQARVAMLETENEGLRAEITKLRHLVTQAKMDVPASNPNLETQSGMSDQSTVLVSAPTSVISSEGTTISRPETPVATDPPVSEMPKEEEVTVEEGVETTTSNDAPCETPLVNQNPLHRIIAQTISAAQEGLVQMTIVAAPLMSRLEPHAKVALAKVEEMWAMVVARAQAVIKQIEPHTKRALIQSREAMKPLEPTVERAKLVANELAGKLSEGVGELSKRTIVLASMCNTQALALSSQLALKYHELEPVLDKAKKELQLRTAAACTVVAGKAAETKAVALTYSGVAKAFVVEKSAEIAVVIKAWTATLASNAKPKLIQIRECSDLMIMHAKQQWAAQLEFVQLKIEPYTLHLATWTQQMAGCMCTPFVGALENKEMASTAHPSSVESSETRA